MGTVGSWLLVAAILVTSLLIAGAKIGGRKYLENLFGELGITHGKALAARRDRRRSRRQVRRAVRMSRPTIYQLEASTTTAMLAPGIRFIPGPLAGRRPLLLVIGPDASRWASSALPLIVKNGGPQQALVIGSAARESPFEPNVKRYTGSFYDQTRDATDDADNLIRDGAADYLCVILRVPILGDFAADADGDLAGVLSYLLEPHRDVWITWLRPVDIRGLPDEVILEGPKGPQASLEILGQAGVRWERQPIVRGAGIVLTRSDAGRALLSLIGDISAISISEPDKPVPEYGGLIQLLMGKTAETELRARVDIVPPGEIWKDNEGWVVRYLNEGSYSTVSPSELVQQSVAYLISVDRQTFKPTHTLEGSTETATTLNVLYHAIEDRDPYLALSPLIQYGRAWIENRDAERYREALAAALQVFDMTTEPGIWSYYLIAIDRMLRSGATEASIFDDDIIELAEGVGLGLLFRAEAMEFARRRGDLGLACERARNILLELLPDPPLERNDSQSYVHGTSRFLVGNLLRRGGLYREAEYWIRKAASIFNENRPAQRVEILHCRYALGVCSAVQGRPILQDLTDIADNESVFAASLILLSNANAAWLTGDPDTARAAAEEAGRGFDSIGYDHYAARTRRLARLLELWIQLEDRRNFKTLSIENGHVRSILSATPGSVVDLHALRPSIALGVLSFGREFSPAGDDLTIALPAVLDSANELKFSATTEVRGLSQADDTLRRKMGISLTARVPLLAD